MTTAINKATQAWNTVNDNFAYLDSKMDNIGDDLANKQDTVTGAVSNVVSENLTANRPVCTNGSGKLRVATTVTNAQLGCLSGATSNIQDQLDNKQPTLVSGTNIKTVNGNSLLGSGNVTIQAGLSYTAVCPAITPVDGVVTWSITHNLGTENIQVTLYSGGNEIVKNVNITSANAISIQFKASSNVTAGSYKVVITGV